MQCLYNCTSFQIRVDDLTEENINVPEFLTRSEVTSIFFKIIAATGLPMTSFSLDFYNPGPHKLCGTIDPARLNLPNLHEQRNIISAWARMEELTLNCTIDSKAIIDLWIILIQHALALQKLKMFLDMGEYSRQCMHYLVLTNTSSELRELSLECVSAGLCITGEKLMF